ncbi:hypothetical protein AXF42_Ash001160 [Apostasia shenzhenica]|uniref:Uncharacterized protein n=1 Tax=Apostasia shenzhenica TaxID=1088818 RepID=A0A2I0AU55_9ASPA|nr:hypothetical protein AXF42_Ash001160 [Apostasia shenzhenica]
MAAHALSTEAIALTEKKMDMTLDDIIKMSKKASSKGKQPPRASNKSQGGLNDRGAQRSVKVQRFLNSRSSIRQGVLAQRRTNFKGNQFPLTTEVARRAAVAPINNIIINPRKQRLGHFKSFNFCLDFNFVQKDAMTNKQKPKTLDALFAGMKEQRIRTVSQQMAVRFQGRAVAQRNGRGGWQQRRGRGGAAGAGSGARFGTFAR